MRGLMRFADYIEAVNDYLGKWISYAVLILIGSVVVTVVMRYAMNLTFTQSYEVISFIFGGYVVLLGAYALLKGSHVRMELVFSRFSPRWQAILDIGTSVLFFIFVIAFLMVTASYAQDSILINQVTRTGTDLPLWPVKLAMPIGGGLLLAQGIAKLIRDIAAVMKKGETP